MNLLEQEVFNSIRSDDVNVFSSRVSERRGILSYCFGRFPVLSLCYLYRSKKILKKFEVDLLAVKSYTQVDEPYEAYEAFKLRAKKALRLYTDGQIVSPAEMLAVCEESLYLLSLYHKFPKNESTAKNIAYVYETTHGQKINADTESISISKIKLSNFQKLAIVLILIFALIFTVAPLPIYYSFLKDAGEGTDLKPFKIANSKGLENALTQNASYVLTRDIILDASYAGAQINCKLNGGGHKIVLNGTPLAETLNDTGTVTNVEFVSSADVTYSDNAGLIVKENKGKFTFCVLTFTGSVALEYTPNDEDDHQSFYVGLFASYNTGSITSCTLNVNASLKGSLGFDSYFGGFVGFNDGQIVSCQTAVGSEILADTFDTAGLVGVNGTKGIIEKCTNNAKVSQSVDVKGWTPLVGGIAVRNNGTSADSLVLRGTIKNCVNFGEVSAYSTTEDSYEGEENLLESGIFVGGITGYNAGTIERCKNVGKIIADGKALSVYAGGIAGWNLNMGIIRNCGALCTFDVNSPAKIITETINDRGDVRKTYKFFLFVGGVSALDYGNTENCFASCVFETENEFASIGGLIGAALNNTMKENNYYVELDGKFGAGTIIVFYYNWFGQISGINIFDGQEFGTEAVEDLDALKATEVYFE